MSSYKTRSMRLPSFLPLLIALSFIFSVSVSGASVGTAGEKYSACAVYEKSSTGAESDCGSLRLIPGGMAFGVKLSTRGVLVIGFSRVKTEEGSVSPAEKAGISVGDIIYEIDGKQVNTADSVISVIEKCGGKPLELSVLRGSRREKLTLIPALSAPERLYKAGIRIRDGSAGIGTVTFIDPSSGVFAGLGHGICDADVGTLMPLLNGSVYGVTVSGVKKGRSGAPGELRGYFTTDPLGSLTGNTDTGVYGDSRFYSADSAPSLPVASRDEVRPGEAYILCTPEGNTVEKYSVEILRISDKKTLSKNFVLEVTDPALLQKTGGIVQGMSGSPVIQNGKLVGAVTHVMINDPKQGYGIFIENMLGNMPAPQ